MVKNKSSGIVQSNENIHFDNTETQCAPVNNFQISNANKNNQEIV